MPSSIVALEASSSRNYFASDLAITRILRFRLIPSGLISRILIGLEEVQ